MRTSLAIRKGLHAISRVHPLQSSRTRALKAFAGPRAISLLNHHLQTQWWPQERLREYQLAKLRRLLEHCYNTVPYYRDTWSEIGFDPRKVHTLEDLHRLPVLTKETIRSQPERFISSAPPFHYRLAQTGASTGNPLVFLRDANASDRAWALYLRLFAWAGYSPGDPVANLWGLAVVPSKSLRRAFGLLLARLRREHLFDAFKMDEGYAYRMLDSLSRIRPVLLRGYVSALETLARYQARSPRHLPSLRGILTTAEKLTEEQRRILEGAFQCPVFDQYGCGECLAIAYECERHHGLHLCVEHCLLEVVDASGNPLPAGETGEVVVTDLDNFVMPFIRYKNGDLATMASEMCPCGRGLPLVASVEGRVSDIIRGLDGQQVHGEFFSHLLEEVYWPSRFEVSQFQVVQHRDMSVTWKVVATIRPSERDVRTLIQHTRRYLGPLPVRVEFVETIPLTAAGKRRFTISELPRN